MRTAVAVALGYVLLMRLFELLHSRRNARILMARGGLYVSPDGMVGIVLVHGAWWIGLLVEELLGAGAGGRSLSAPFLWLFAGAEGLRIWCIASLGERWNVRVLVLGGEAVVRSGPYALLRHPNYVAVVVGLVALPLGLGLPWTGLVTLGPNLLVLRRRVRIEDEALREAASRTPST